MMCTICENPRIKKNSAGTRFCARCRYGITWANNIHRMVKHPLFKTLGHEVKPDHPDFEFDSKKTFIRKPARSIWARNED